MIKFIRLIKGDSSGFTLLEMLIALGVISSCTILFAAILQLLPALQTEDFYEEDVIGITQLRYLLAQSKDVRSSQHRLQFQYRKEDFELHQTGTYLIKSPGTQIFLQQLDTVSFKEENGCIMMHVERGEHIYDGLLWCR